MVSVATSAGWRREADGLLAAGYVQVERKNSIVPYEFHKEGEETLYLFRPVGNLGDNERVYVPSDRWMAYATMKGVDRKLVLEYIPSDEYDPGNPDKALRKTKATLRHVWVPRTLSTFPREFTISDAAEHLGLSEPSIKAAVYHTNTLIPDRMLTGARIIIFNESTLIRWSDQRADEMGIPRKPEPMQSNGQLARLVRNRLENGEISPEQIALIVSPMGDNLLADVAEAAIEGRLGEKLATLPREALVALAQAEQDEVAQAA